MTLFDTAEKDKNTSAKVAPEPPKIGLSLFLKATKQPNTAASIDDEGGQPAS